jgi:phage tail-like protein
MSRAYRFTRASHWRAGASRGFAEVGDRLDAQPPLDARPERRIPPGWLVAPGPCGAIRLLDPLSGLVARLEAHGPEEEGRLTGLAAPLAIAADGRWLWVAEEDRLLRYDTGSLQYAGATPLPGLRAIAGDGAGGVWTAVAARAGAALRHIDRWGAPSRGCTLEVAGEPAAALAASPCGGWLVLLAGSASDWRLAVYDVRRSRAEPAFRVEELEGGTAAVAVDRGGDILVAGPGRLLRYERSGVLAGDDPLDPPGPEDPVHGLFATSNGLLLVGAAGAWRIAPAAAASGSGRLPVFVTPALVSPDGIPSGWRRAEIDATLSKGATLRVRLAATRDAATIDKATASFALPSAARLAAVDASLPWRERERVYRGDGVRRRFHFLLDGLPETHIWLRIEAAAPAGAPAPVLHALTILYPDGSWLDDLPAIYREDPLAAAELRRFLAPLETLFDELDERIAALPGRIDPATAPDACLGELLQWLGFPPTDELAPDRRRALLRRASELLAGRGTLAALREVLDIVTNGRARVSDSGSEAFLWVLGPAAAPRLRLGRETRLVAAAPAALRLGGPALGGAPLGRGGCVDVAALARAACATVRIRIAIPPDERAALEPVLAGLLAMFVPAYCRIDRRWQAPGTLEPAGLLDADAMLAGNDGEPLAAGSRAGRWRLPSEPPSILSLDADAAFSGGRRLA